MATGYSAEMTGVLDGTLNPPKLADGRVVGGRMHIYQATFDLSKANVAKNIGDVNICFPIPADCKPVLGWLESTVSMGAAATIAVGNATTPGKYRAPAVHTAPDAPAFFMLSAAAQLAPLSDPETVQITIAAAALPGAGILQVFMIVAKI
ncbi:MAG TPA: hypothetical protein VFW22_16475 [Pseudolabrys sp.]|nr:hypothetical protein [Pseudolabrys sp.]